jgi:peroxiredoxin
MVALTSMEILRRKNAMKTIVRSMWQCAVMTVLVVGCTQADRVSNERDPSAGSSAPDATAEVTVAAGHSAHGEAFNEGPRQAAYLFPGNGAVHLSITTNAQAQSFFDQGLGQLHGFWYFEAERSFRQVAMIDPTCAMAYWGMAMANINNDKRARGFIADAMRRRSSVTKIERMHIDALSAYYDEKSKANKKARRAAYLAALNDIIKEFPNEIETKALAVRYRWEYRDDVKLKDADYASLNQWLDDIFAVNPLHPAHHYRIHLMDDKDAKQALASAAQCGQSSPAIAHMWHMPGHIYSKLQRFDDAAWQQEASARVDHAHMMQDRVLPDQIHNYAHNNEWLCRDLMIIGRMSDALDLAHNMESLPRHPAYNTLKKGSSELAIKRLYDIHYRFELWDAMVEWTDQLAKDPLMDEQAEVDRQRARGVAFAHLGQTKSLADTTADLASRLLELEKKQTIAGQEAFDRAEKSSTASAEKTVKKEVKKEVNHAETKKEEKKEEIYDSKSDEKDDHDDEKAVVAESSQKKDSKVKGTEKKAEPAVKKSPAELAKEKARKDFDRRVEPLKSALAELHFLASVAAGPSDEAKKLLDVCAKEVPALRLARYYLMVGDHEKAVAAAKKTVGESNGDHSVLPLALLAHVLFATDHLDEARKTFAQLRALCSQADLTAPPLARLAPLAKACDAPVDWRAPLIEKTDVGKRPALDTLGPFRWQPSPALPWSLPDAEGKRHSLSDYHGKPVVVIFYLGYGCVYCTEQLSAFAPMAQAYKDAGIQLIGVSTDSVADLKRALAPVKFADAFPFPLVADPSKEIFKTYRAFDDFEKIPLHGTFLIDGNGLVRWQDISFEPFMDATFLLHEAKRLLAMVKTS